MMDHFLSLFFWSSIGLAILAVVLALFDPKYRKQFKIQSTRATLQESFAKEIAAGTAVFIPKDPAEFKKSIFIIACGGVFVLIFQKFKIYVDSLQQTCTAIGGWNSLIFFLGTIFIVGGLLMLCLIVKMYKDYKEIIKDGFVPSRKSKASVDRISFKLTKWLKIREQLRLIGFITCSIFLMSSPLLILQIFMNTPTHKITSIYVLNEHLQTACLTNLKKKA